MSNIQNQNQEPIVKVLELALDETGQRIFGEVCSSYYQQPQHGLKFSYNITHGEFGCEAGTAIGMFYLASNTSDRRWAIQYIDTVAYGANPGDAHMRLTQLLLERAMSKMHDINSVAFNDGCGNWVQYRYPHHVREDQRTYGSC